MGKQSFEVLALKATKEIYSRLPIKEMKIINMGNGSNDPVIDMITKIMTSVKCIKKEA